MSPRRTALDAIPGPDRCLLLSGGHLRELVLQDDSWTRAQVVVELVAPHHFARGDAPPSWMPHVEEVPVEGVWRCPGARWPDR